MFSRMLKKNSVVWEFLFDNFGQIIYVEKKKHFCSKIQELEKS